MYEILWEQILFDLVVDEDVRKGRGRHGDVRGTRADHGELAYQPVDARGLVIRLRGVHGRVVAFVIDDEDGQIRIELGVLEPPVEFRKHRGILLDHRDVRGDRVPCGTGHVLERALVGLAEIIVVRQRGHPGNVPYGQIPADARLLPVMITDEISVYSHLGLLAQVLVVAREHDDELVSAIRGLVHERDVGARLSRLHIAENQAFAPDGGFRWPWVRQ